MSETRLCCDCRDPLSPDRPWLDPRCEDCTVIFRARPRDEQIILEQARVIAALPEMAKKQTELCLKLHEDLRAFNPGLPLLQNVGTLTETSEQRLGAVLKLFGL